MKGVSFNNLPEAIKDEIIRNIIGINLNDNDYDQDEYDNYMDIMSKENALISGFSDDYSQER